MRPAIRPESGPGAVDHELLERGTANTLPEFVGEGDEQLLNGHCHLRPAGMGETDARELRADAVLDQAAFARGFVFVAPALELASVEDLPSIVKDDADANEVCPNRDAEISKLREQCVRRFADELYHGVAGAVVRRAP